MTLRGQCTECGARLFSPRPITSVCNCGARVQIPSSVAPEDFPDSDPVPFDEWPTWAKIVASRQIEDDLGVGSTIERYASKFGGSIFKWWAQKLGIPCGCNDRRDEWNLLYCYSELPENC